MQRRGNKINSILYDRYHLQNYKVITLEKSQIIQNINILMFKVIFIFFNWILIKQITVSSIPFCPGEWIISSCMVGDDKILGGNFWLGSGTWVKLSRFNAFSANANTRNLKIFPKPGWNIQVWQNIQQEF